MSTVNYSIWKKRKPCLFINILYFALMSGPPRFRSRDMMASIHGDIDWVVVLNLIIWGAAGLWVLKRLLKDVPINRFNITCCIGLLMCTLLAISAIKSPGWKLTIYASYQLCIMLLFNLLYFVTYGYKETVSIMFKTYLILCLSLVVAAFLAPHLVYPFIDGYTPKITTRMRGDLLVPTGFVAGSLLLLLIAGAVKIKNKLAYISFIMLAVTLLIISQTRSAYGGVLIVMLVSLLFKKRSLLLLKIIYISIFVLLCVTLLYKFPSGMFSAISDWVIRDPKSIHTISGRIPIWQYSISYVVRHSPWLGVGYYASSRLITSVVNPGIGTAHSFYIEVILGGGIPSALLIIAIIIINVRNILLTIMFQSAAYNDEIKMISYSLVSLNIFSMIMLSVESINTGPSLWTFWSTTVLLSYLNLHKRVQDMKKYAYQDIVLGRTN